MPESPRSARVRALAKLNLVLEILNKRPDGFHNLRTIFQTISLHDTLDVEYTPARKTAVELESNVEIANNLVVRAAEAVLESSNARGRLKFRLQKRIPMGGGLGGGSTNAAAVLLAVPVLTGRQVSLDKLLELAGSLGSDVPFSSLAEPHWDWAGEPKSIRWLARRQSTFCSLLRACMSRPRKHIARSGAH